MPKVSTDIKERWGSLLQQRCDDRRMTQETLGAPWG